MPFAVPARLVCVLLALAACDGSGEGDAPGRAGSAGAPADGAPAARTASGMVEGKDYVVFQRVRLLDEMGFDQPVEAMSVLAPRGWTVEGGVRWRGVQECRGEIVTWQMAATSPDGQIRYRVLPLRAYVYQEDPMLRQGAVAAAQQGGCEVSQPFDAARYLERLARTELEGATVSDVRADERLQARLAQMDASANATSRQYGTNMSQTSSVVYGTLTWPDGTKGLAQVLVSVASSGGRNLYGGPSGFSTTSVLHRAYVRYPPAREAEALKVFGTFDATHRVNPVWQQARTAFLTRLGNMEHAGRMERLRLQGEQAAAYARAQSEASDQRMRDWERSQASSDANQRGFIQTIREVETWKDASGSPVELSAGYTYGWSKPDGSIILTNNSLFDPAVELKQSWERMQKVARP